MARPPSGKSSPVLQETEEKSVRGSSSGGARFKGVRMRKWGKWVAEVRLPNSRERIWLGSYETQEKAARAYDAAVFCLRGPGAQFNFPDDPPSIPAAGSLTPAQIQVAAARFAHGEDRDHALASMPAPTTMQEVSLEGGAVDYQDQGKWPMAETFMSEQCGGSELAIFGSSFEVYPGDAQCFYPTETEDDEEDNDEGGAFYQPPGLWNF